MNRYDYYNRLLSSLLIVAATVILVPSQLLAQVAGLTSTSRLSGSAALEYVSYDARGEGEPKLDASSLVQRYSLLYRTEGYARDKRIGSYKLALGYDWTSLDSTVTAGPVKNDYSMQSGRILYDADILINPVQLPFSFRAYSRDMGKSQIETDGDYLLSNGNRLITPGIATSQTTPGTNIQSGFRLIFGGDKPGSKFRQYFILMPVFLVDYNDTYTRNDSSNVSSGNRLQNWNISAKSGDNWIHYRTTHFRDFVLADSNYEEKQIQIGLIDDAYRRQWIQLTNWIKISADGQYTRRTGVANDKELEEYDLNLFADASRRTWQARTFTNFNREITSGSFIDTRKIPLSLSGVWNADTDWSILARSDDTRSMSVVNGQVAPGSTVNTSNLYGSLKVNTFKRRNFTLSSGASVERIKTTGGAETLGLELSVESRSTPRFSRDLNMDARLSARSFVDLQHDQKSYSSDLAMNARYQWNRTFFVNFTDTVSVGGGDQVNSSSSNINQNSTRVFDAGGNAGTNLGGVGSITNTAAASVSWTPVAKLQLSLGLGHTLSVADGQPTRQIASITNDLSYMLPKGSIQVSNFYTRDDDGAGNVTSNILSKGNVKYQPFRQTAALLRYGWSRSTSGDRTTSELSLLQSVSYSLFRRTGINSRLVDLYEEMEYVKSDFNPSKKTVLVRAVYYPFSRLSLNGRASYDFLNRTTMYGGGVGAHFKLADASADYTYAKRDGDKRLEHRFSAKVQKNF